MRMCGASMQFPLRTRDRQTAGIEAAQAGRLTPMKVRMTPDLVIDAHTSRIPVLASRRVDRTCAVCTEGKARSCKIRTTSPPAATGSERHREEP